MSREMVRPAPTRDLDSPDEVAEMVRRFYQDVAQDDLLGPMFNDVAQVDWGEHLGKLTRFWCRALFGLQGYVGNPFRAHVLIHQRSAFTAAHFERWLSLFHDTVELGWVGPNAHRALELAHNVARVHSNQLVGMPVAGSPAPPIPAPPTPGDRTSPEDADQGGDPPCWEGRIVDHRDRPSTIGAGPS